MVYGRDMKSIDDIIYLIKYKKDVYYKNDFSVNIIFDIMYIGNYK